MKKVLIKGAYGTKNFGDDLLMVITTRILKSINCSVDILAPNHKYINKLIPGCNLNTYNKNNDYDLLVYGGGTQFYNFKGIDNKSGEIKNKVKNMVSLFSNPRRIKGALLRRFYKAKPIENKAYIGLGLGPFHNKQIKDTTLKNFENSLFIGIRDRKSSEYLESFNINYSFGADLCFSSYFSEINNISQDIDKKYDLGIILRDWNLTQEGIVAQSEIDALISAYKNKKIIFLFFSDVHDCEWIDFCIKRKYEYSVWNPDKNSIECFLEQIAECKHILSSRFHGLVLASLLKIPFTGLSIEPKIRLFIEKYKCFDYISFPFNNKEIAQSLAQNKLWDDEAEFALNKEKDMSNVMIDNFLKTMGR